MTGVLVDTSVWVEHFHKGSSELITLLGQDRVCTHPMVLGELACGTPPERVRTLADLGSLRHTEQATVKEVMDFVDRERLYGFGCGLIDIVLLTSALMSPGISLWTLDKRLATLAKRFDILYGKTH